MTLIVARAPAASTAARRLCAALSITCAARLVAPDARAPDPSLLVRSSGEKRTRRIMCMRPGAWPAAEADDWENFVAPPPPPAPQAGDAGAADEKRNESAW